jgi:hypothetical protein
MYWLDGSSKLPFVPRCSYILSSSRARAFAQAEALIENQARILKSCVKIANFDHWCIEASELVDLVIDFALRDEKYLRRDGLSTREEGSTRISNLTSQFVKLVCFSTFERAVKRLRANSRSTQSRIAPLATTTTSSSRTTTTTTASLLTTTTNAPIRTAVTSATPPSPRHRPVPVPVGVPNPPTSRAPSSNERRSKDRVGSHTREGDGKERRGEKREEGQEVEKEREREGVRQELSKPPPPPPPTNGAHTQGEGKRRRRRRCCRRHCRCHCTAPNPPLAAGSPKRVPAPTKHPGKHHHPPPNRTPPPHDGGEQRNRQRRRRHRRRHRRLTPASAALGVPPHNPTLLPGKDPPPSPVSPNHRRDTAPCPSPRHRPARARSGSTPPTIASYTHECPPNGRLAMSTRVGKAKVREEKGEKEREDEVEEEIEGLEETRGRSTSDQGRAATRLPLHPHPARDWHGPGRHRQRRWSFVMSSLASSPAAAPPLLFVPAPPVQS